MTKYREELPSSPPIVPQSNLHEKRIDCVIFNLIVNSICVPAIPL